MLRCTRMQLRTVVIASTLGHSCILSCAQLHEVSLLLSMIKPCMRSAPTLRYALDFCIDEYRSGGLSRSPLLLDAVAVPKHTAFRAGSRQGLCMHVAFALVMCLSVFLYNWHPKLLLLLAFNRDEFFLRWRMASMRCP